MTLITHDKANIETRIIGSPMLCTNIVPRA